MTVLFSWLSRLAIESHNDCESRKGRARVHITGNNEIHPPIPNKGAAQAERERAGCPRRKTPSPARAVARGGQGTRETWTPRPLSSYLSAQILIKRGLYCFKPPQGKACQLLKLRWQNKAPQSHDLRTLAGKDTGASATFSRADEPRRRSPWIRGGRSLGRGLCLLRKI